MVGANELAKSLIDPGGNQNLYFSLYGLIGTMVPSVR